MKKTKPLLATALGLTFLFLAFLGGYVYSGLKFIPPHFHANFSMYINGQRVDFSGDEFMEDVAGCSLTGLMYPEDRVHLHENNPDTIHIHDEGVSWGHFFANNGFVFDENTLATNQSQVFTTNDTDKLVYVLNGNIVENPFNMLINSKDRLLITYGGESEQEIQERFAQVSDNAGEYNDRYDPGSCGGTNENAIAVLISDFFGDKH